MSYEPIPVSQATTAYELFEELVQVIEEEPLRLRMDHFITASRSKSFFDSREDTLEYLTRRFGGAPKCGTVACFGGWLSLLWYGENVTVKGIEARVKRLIAGDNQRMNDALADLFYTFPEHMTYGTPEYKEWAIQQLRTFMTLHEEFLKNRHLTKE